MAYEILTESYGRRLPKITAEADSTDDLATLGTNYAEGSTCVIGDKTYSLDKVQGWVEPGSGGGSGGVFWVNFTWDEEETAWAADKTVEEIFALVNAGQIGFGKYNAMVHSLYSSGERHATFVASDFEESAGYSSQFDISQDGTVTRTAWTWTVEED